MTKQEKIDKVDELCAAVTNVTKSVCNSEDPVKIMMAVFKAASLRVDLLMYMSQKTTD